MARIAGSGLGPCSYSQDRELWILLEPDFGYRGVHGVNSGERARTVQLFPGLGARILLEPTRTLLIPPGDGVGHPRSLLFLLAFHDGYSGYLLGLFLYLILYYSRFMPSMYPCDLLIMYSFLFLLEACGVYHILFIFLPTCC